MALHLRQLWMKFSVLDSIGGQVWKLRRKATDASQTLYGEMD